VRLLTSLGHATGLLDDLTESAQPSLEPGRVIKMPEETTNKATHCLGGFDQALVRVLPAGGEANPVLHQDADQLGIAFTKNTPGLLTARFVEVSIALPELEKQLNLPAQPRQNEYLGRTRQGCGHIAKVDVPGSQEQRLSTDNLSFFLGLAPQLLTPLLSHCPRQLLGYQPTG
jgi:hypothetical protein